MSDSANSIIIHLAISCGTASSEARANRKVEYRIFTPASVSLIVILIEEVASHIHEDRNVLELWAEQYILLPVGLVDASLA